MYEPESAATELPLESLSMIVAHEHSAFPSAVQKYVRITHLTRPVVRSVRVRLCTLTFHGYARLRTLTPQHSARLCTLGLGDTEVDLLYSHAQVLCRKKIGAGGIFV